MNPQRLLLTAVTFCVVLTAFRSVAPQTEPKHIKWLTVEEAYKLNQTTPRKFVIDVYTDWCGWCKVMDRETFSKPAIIDYVNANYYAVRLNAEQKEDIVLGNRTYRSLGNAHELAANLLQNKLSYPTTVFMDEKFQPIQPIAGYLEPRVFHQVVTFFGGNYHQKEPFDQFKSGTYVREFQPAMPAPTGR